MAKKIDYLLDENFDLLIESGDFKQGDSADAHSKIILFADIGDLRQFPLLAGSIRSYIGSSVPIDVVEQAISEQLTKDNLVISEIDVVRNNNAIDVDLKIL